MHNQPHSLETKKLISEKVKIKLADPKIFAHLSRIRRLRNRPPGISLIKKCVECGRNFRRPVGMGWNFWVNRMYCSKKCNGIAFGKAQRGEKNINYGKFGKDSPAWKGNKIGYAGIHRWLVQKFGKAQKCENPECLQRGKTYEWARLKGKQYERKRENFWQLCHSCHKKYDYKKVYSELLK